MPAGRPTKRQSYVHDEMRAKIKTTLIVKKLTEHVVGDEKLEPSQVTAALGLLKKTLPDLSAATVEHDVSDNLAELLTEIDGATRGLPDGHADSAEKPTLQ